MPNFVMPIRPSFAGLSLGSLSPILLMRNLHRAALRDRKPMRCGCPARKIGPNLIDGVAAYGLTL